MAIPQHETVIILLKCMACPVGESQYNNPYLSAGYWENKENNIHIYIHYIYILKSKKNII